MAAKGLHRSLFQIGERPVKPEDSRNVRSARFKTIRKKERNFFHMRKTSRPAAEKRSYLSGEFVAYQKASCSLRAAEPFMSGKSQRVYMKRFHVNGKNSRGLRCVQKKKKVMLLTEISDLLDRHDRTAYIGSVQTDKEPCFRPEKVFRLV